MMKYDKELYPFDSKWIILKGQKIHYIDEGTGQTILFSHAPLGSSFMFRRFVQILSKDYRCIALDYPGFGLSSNVEGKSYSIVSQSKIAQDFVLALDLQNIIALGHDTGGPSIFRVAGLFPQLFKGIILTDTIIFPTKEYPKIHRMLKIIGSRFFRFINNRTNLLTRITFNKGVVTRNLRKEEKQQYYRLFNTYDKRDRITELLHSLRVNEAFMINVKSGFEHQLNHKPALLIYGENDPVTKMGIPERIHAMMPNSAMYFIRNEGHFPHEGQPERMCDIINQWIINLQ